MKKRVLSLFLALCLFGGNCLTAFAETAYIRKALLMIWP